MAQFGLTKISCLPADNEFIVIFLRSRKISKSDLDLRPSMKTTLKITNPSIKALILEHYDDYKQSRLSIQDYFNINLIFAVNRGRDKCNPLFNLQQAVFDEAREVCDYYCYKISNYFSIFRQNYFYAIVKSDVILRWIYHCLNLVQK